MKILDFGARTNRLKKLIEYYQKNCDGYIMLDKRPETADVIQFEYREGRRIPYADESFDIILAISSLQYIDSISNILKEFKRMLKPGGHIIITYPMFLWDQHKTRGYALRPLREEGFQISLNSTIGGEIFGYYYIEAKKVSI